MPIQSIQGAGIVPGLLKVNDGPKPTPSESQKSFGMFLKNAIQDVNIKQIESDKMTQKLVLGEDVDLHNVMITAQKASIALSATMEVRNKAIEAYQEIIRMPV
ncbi:flagellar hook-basal body complex protein FliE [Sporosarcina luteola]|uniref:flagellar hook-basal body complex protein FliE n=1 Tax=Sporosarcina luteola TaxID=582850 RepID=UPI00204132EB|nr:flagellar hook-basal body complex protein FliE [Sporosarcina luteola]MCM3742828.1 flagellar hook-basal body complex protein FliE [Sporosarcina luteola]